MIFVCAHVNRSGTRTGPWPLAGLAVLCLAGSLFGADVTVGVDYPDIQAAFDKLKPNEQKAVKDAAKVAEERGWKMSIEEMTVKTAALKAAGIKVTAPTPELKAGFAKIGDTIAGEWAKSAGADGAAMLAAYRK